MLFISLTRFYADVSKLKKKQHKENKIHKLKSQNNLLLPDQQGKHKKRAHSLATKCSIFQYHSPWLLKYNRYPTGNGSANCTETGLEKHIQRQS